MTAMEEYTSKLKANESGASDMMIRGLLAASLSSVLVCGVPVTVTDPVITKAYLDGTHYHAVIKENSALVAKHPKVVTERGRKMLELRKKAVDKGMKLLTQDELLAEVHERRGELG